MKPPTSNTRHATLSTPKRYFLSLIQGQQSNSPAAQTYVLHACAPYDEVHALGNSRDPVVFQLPLGTEELVHDSQNTQKLRRRAPEPDQAHVLGSNRAAEPDERLTVCVWAAHPPHTCQKFACKVVAQFLRVCGEFTRRGISVFVIVIF